MPSEVPRLTTDLPVRVFPGVWKPLFFKTPFPGQSSVPSSFVSFFIFYIFSYLLLKTMGCFSGCLMSSASIQKLFCGIYSAFKCSFDEFVGEKVFLRLLRTTSLNIIFIVRRCFLWNWSQTETLFFYRNVNNDFNFMSYGEHNFLHHLTDCHFSLMERFILEK